MEKRWISRGKGISSRSGEESHTAGWTWGALVLTLQCWSKFITILKQRLSSCNTLQRKLEAVVVTSSRCVWVC